jgi:hypothetical protein
MNFEGQSASGAKDVCDLSAIVWILSDLGSGFDSEDVSIGYFQFTVTEMRSVLLDLDDDKGADPDGVSPLDF